ncbi:hypothetical protein V3F56_06260 [Moorellaceae bacterium AZ2]
MAVLWVSRQNRADTLVTALRSLIQELVEKKARKYGLSAEYDTSEEDCIDLVVEGNARSIAALVREVYETTGVCGFVIDVETADEQKEMSRAIKDMQVFLIEVVDV